MNETPTPAGEPAPTTTSQDPAPLIESPADAPQAAEEAAAPAAEAVEAAEAGEAGEAAATDAAAPAEMSPAAVAAKLKELFPALFGGPGFKPLKLRVQADIQQRAPGIFSRAQLSAFLRRYTGNTGYLIALGKATQRFDLDGQEAGELSEEHRNAAREELARRKGLQQERIHAEREQMALAQQQRRNRAGLLYDYERTTLTLANFCVLKGVTPEELPGLLEIAKQERAEQPPRPEPRRDDRGGRPGSRPEGRPEGRPNQRRDARPEGRDGPQQQQRPPRKPQPPRG
ncbi:ProQ/FinO family protein [Roseateles violae]|uniref:ProQ/FinO family protein n=1 Tax=Roseateles violae TaxID=3058042 RepID=A0ABT8DMF4_9BURK|nr:ProQ/FinO family protein [Pelomonas sp. PFR6]MDN3919570.1 ProQ/FinO family protein [Pelomonas sp. PFR6]